MPKIKSLKETLKRFAKSAAKSAAQGAAKVTKGISGLTKDKTEQAKLLANSLNHIANQKTKKEMLEKIKDGPTINKYFKPGDNENKAFQKGSVTGIMIKQLYDYLSKQCNNMDDMLKALDEKPDWLKCKTAESIKKELKKALPVNWTKSVLYDKKVLEALAKINKKINEWESELSKQYLSQLTEEKSAQQMAGSVQVFPAIKQPPPVRTRKSNSQLNTNSSPSNISIKQQKSPSSTQKTWEKGISPKNNGAKKIILSNNRHSLPPTTNQIIDTARSYANDIYNKALNLNVDENLKATFKKTKDKLKNTPNDKIKFSGEKLSFDDSFKKLKEFRGALSNILNKLEKTGENNLTQNIENDLKIINTYLGLDNTPPLTQNQSKNSTNTKTPPTNSKEKVQEDKKTSNATTQANTKTENEHDIFKELIEDLYQKPLETGTTENVEENVEKNNIDDFLNDILKTL